jgi:glucose-6-phosphate dehydrogenase assembly protein OpcA
MVTENPSDNIGTPMPVDVASIEQELARLWKSASATGGGTAVIRACSCNLVVIAEDRAKASALLPVLARVAEWQPARFIVAYREPTAEARLDAWISAQCSLPILGGPQICSEAITVAATDKTADNLPNTVLSLLVPDLPVYLYWRSFREPDWDWVNRITHFSSLLIVDSHQSKDDPDNRHRILRALADASGSLPVRDLNWSRLTAWRDLVAQFFDNPGFREDVHHISEVEISRSLGAPGNIPTRTLLLTGWLASRLNWRMISVDRTTQDWVSRWRSASGEVVVRFNGNPAPPGDPPGISAITLRTRKGNTFSVTRDTGSSVLKAVACGHRPELTHSVPQESMDEADLLAAELSLSGEDTGFRDALVQALDLETAFRR